jgi:large subunit ribosomal protein L35
MPKQKTRKAASKRFKKTGTGKFTHHKAGGRHLKSSKSAKRKRQLRKATVISATETKRLTTSMPYA